MTDGHGLPRHPFPALLPEAGGFEEAIGRARKRRRRQAMEATAMLSVAALFAGGFLVSRPALDSTARLDSTHQPSDTGGDGPRVTRGLDPTPGPTISTAPGGEPQHPSTGGGGSSSAPAAPSGHRPSAGVKTDRGTVPAPPKPPKGYSVKYADERRTETFGTDCRTAATEEWCLFGEVSNQAPNQYKLTTVVCRGIDATESALTFPSEQEVDFQILLNGQVRWTWSYGQNFEPGQRDLQVAAGECVAWDVRWDADDEDGRLLVPSEQAGDYTLRVRSTASQLGERTATRTFSVE